MWADWVGAEWNGDCWGVDRRITSPQTVEAASEGPADLLPPVTNLWSSPFQELFWGSIAGWEMDDSPDCPEWFLEEVASYNVWFGYRTRAVVHKPDAEHIAALVQPKGSFSSAMGRGFEPLFDLCFLFFLCLLASSSLEKYNYHPPCFICNNRKKNGSD